MKSAPGLVSFLHKPFCFISYACSTVLVGVLLILALSGQALAQTMSPRPSSNLTASTTFQWSGKDSTTRRHKVLVGTTTPGSSDVHASAYQNVGVTSYQVTNIPTGKKVFVQLIREESWGTKFWDFEYNVDLDEDGIKDHLEQPGERSNASLPGTPLVRQANDYKLTVLGSGRVASLESSALFSAMTVKATAGAANLQLTTTRILEQWKDEFDFIFVANNRDSYPDRTTEPTSGFYSHARSTETSGNGTNTLGDNGLAFGSAAKLQGAIHFANLNSLVYGPALHELMHRWGNKITQVFPENPFDRSHWQYSGVGGQLGGFKPTSENGPSSLKPFKLTCSTTSGSAVVTCPSTNGLYIDPPPRTTNPPTPPSPAIAVTGDGIPPNATVLSVGDDGEKFTLSAPATATNASVELSFPGRYTASPLPGRSSFAPNVNGANTTAYSQLELYLMGMIPKSEVTDVWEVATGVTHWDWTSSFNATNIVTKRISDVVAAYNERVPTAATSLKAFRSILVVLTDTPLTHAQWADADESVESFARTSTSAFPKFKNFWDATGSRGSLIMGNLAQALRPELSALALSPGTLSPAFAPGTLTYSTVLPSGSALLGVTPTAATAGSTIEVRTDGSPWQSVNSGATIAQTLPIGPSIVEVRVSKDGHSRVYVVNAATITPVAGAGLGDIPDGGGTSRDITFTISGKTGDIAEVAVDFALAPKHPWWGDLKIELISPIGTMHTVLEVPSHWWGKKLGGPYYFKDTATNTQQNTGGELPSGNYRTQRRVYSDLEATKLADTFRGKAPNGTWTLRFTDSSKNEQKGSVSAANLYISTGSPAQSGNNNLSSLVLGSGTPALGFDPNTISYSASVPYATSGITVTPTRADANAQIQVKVGNGAPVGVLSGTASGTLPLIVGANSIQVIVTAQSGSTKTYTVNLTRNAAAPTVTTNAQNNVQSTSAFLGGEVTDTGGVSLIERGIVWAPSATSTAPTISHTKALIGTSASFSGVVGSLPAGTSLHVRAFATNSVGTSYGSAISFTTPVTVVPPTVLTVDASPITGSSVTLRGTVSSDGNGALITRGVVYTSTGGVLPTVGTHSTVATGTSTGAFNGAVSSLGNGTTLYFRAYAQNSAGTSYGTLLSATTLTGPTVTSPTNDLTAITGTTAKLGGTVSSDGGSTITARGIVYAPTSTNANPTLGGGGVFDVPASGTTGVFTTPVTQLTAGTNYTFKAYATNAATTAYSSPASFITPSLPTVTTAAATGIASNGTSATLGGSITGGTTLTQRGVVFSDFSNPTVENHTKAVTGTTSGAFSDVVSGLAAGKTYYVRAFATVTGAGTAYGAEVSFTTPGLPTVNTQPATTITGTSAKLHGSIASDGGSTVSARGFVWATTPTPTMSSNVVTVGSGTGVFDQIVTLPATSTIYFRAYATNGVGTKLSDTILSVITPSAPTVATIAPTAVTATSVATGSNVTNDGGSTVFSRGVAWSIAPGVPTETSNPSLTGTGTGSSPGTLNGLPPGTAINLRAFATNIAGTSFGTQHTINTPAALSISSPSSSSIGQTTATLGGNVTSDGGATLTARGVVYSPSTTNDNPVLGDPGVVNAPHGSASIGVFTVDVSSLTAGTSYTFKAYASVGATIVYTTPAQRFTTTSPTPPPTIGSLSPNVSGLAGGTAAFLTGTGLTGTTAVSIGGVAVTNLTVVNSTTLQFNVPASATIGTKTVQVTAPTGSAVADAFRYTDFVVTNTNDSGLGSLRQAVDDTNNGAAVDQVTITFAPALAGQTIALRPSSGSDALNIAFSLGTTIDASALAGGITLTEGAPDTRLFFINSDCLLDLRNVTLTRAEGAVSIGSSAEFNAVDCVFSQLHGNDGGAIYNEGTLTLLRCSFTNNTAETGGAIFNRNLLTARRCTFSGNTASWDSGAVDNRMNSTSDATFEHCTFSGNSANAGGAFTNKGQLTLEHCTVSGNRADEESGGIWNAAGINGQTAYLTLKNSIVFGNVGGDIKNPSTGRLTRTGPSLVGQITISPSYLLGTGTLSTATPKLGPLASNGGPTQTMALLNGSPAIDAAIGSTITADQRGTAVFGGVADIGAYEFTQGLDTLTGNNLGNIPDRVGTTDGVREITFDMANDGSVTKTVLRFTLNPAHTFVGDLVITLTAPDGTQHGVMSMTGTDKDDNLGGPYVFTDDATTTLSAAAALLNNGLIPAGNYRTQNGSGTATSLATSFNSKPARGTWRLRFVDTVNVDTGTVSAASLELSTANIPATAPVVSTDTPIIDLQSAAATLGGDVGTDGGDDLTECGVVWSTTNNPPTTADTKHVAAIPAVGPFTVDVPDLPRSVPVYIRAFATNSIGTSYGDLVTITIPAAPTVENPTVNLVTESTATLGGEVTDAGGGSSSITERGIVVALTAENSAPEVGGRNVERLPASGGLGVFTVGLGGLRPGNSYSFAAYAQNATGTGYSSYGTFTTAILKPDIQIDNLGQTVLGAVVGWGQNTLDAAVAPSSLSAGALAVDAGNEFSAAINVSGGVTPFGYLQYGCDAVPVAAQSGVVAVSLGLRHILALREDGNVVAWGDNSRGQTNVPALPPGVTYTAIASSWLSCIALRSDGTIVGWGGNVYGEASPPALPPGLTYTAVTANAFHAAAVRSDGRVITWGNNTNVLIEPVPPAAQSGVIAVSTGNGHILALKSDGSVIAWGSNDDGQTTVPAAASSGVVSIAAGGAHSLALKADGTVLAWGYNEFGSTDVPAAIQGRVSAIAAGDLHSLAIVGSLVDFGTQQVGYYTRYKTFTIHNTGTGPLYINNIVLTGGNPGDFQLSTTASGSGLAPGASETFFIRFGPAAVGQRQATVCVLSDDPDEPRIDLTLNGTGAALPPTVLSVGPSAGFVAGGNTVAIYGTVFTDASAVTIGGNPATNVFVLDDSTILCTVPAGTLGSKDVVVTTPQGTGTGTGLYRYTDLIVTTTADSGPGSLRQALSDAAAITGPNTITFAPALAGQTIAVFASSLESAYIIDDLGGVTIQGPTTGAGITLTKGTPDTRIFLLRYGSLTLNHLTFANCGSSVIYGGGAIKSGDETSAPPTTPPVLVLNRCTLHSNTAFTGGAIHTATSTSTVLRQCTLAGNSAFTVGAVNAQGPIELEHCTLSGNSASSIGALAFSQPSTMRNSIVAGNAANDFGRDVYVSNVSVALVGKNLAQNFFSYGTLTGSFTNADPQLGPLSANGGPTQTMAIGPGSPALNAAIGSLITTDQRGVIVATVPDVGAYEGRSIIEAWRDLHFGDPNGTGLRADDASGGDSDGVHNLLEFAFGLNPNGNDSRSLQRGGTFTSGNLALTGLPIVGIEPTQFSLDYRAVFVRRRDHAAAGLIYTPEFSALLNVWQASTATPTVLATSGNYELVTVPYLPFVGGRKAQFFRIRVDMAP